MTNMINKFFKHKNGDIYRVDRFAPEEIGANILFTTNLTTQSLAVMALSSIEEDSIEATPEDIATLADPSWSLAKEFN